MVAAVVNAFGFHLMELTVCVWFRFFIWLVASRTDVVLVTLVGVEASLAPLAVIVTYLVVVVVVVGAAGLLLLPVLFSD